MGHGWFWTHSWGGGTSTVGGHRFLISVAFRYLLISSLVVRGSGVGPELAVSEISSWVVGHHLELTATEGPRNAAGGMTRLN